MKRIIKLIYIILCIIGIIWFSLPLLKRGYGTGSIFGTLVCLFGIFLILCYRRIAEKGGWKRVCIRSLSGCYIAGMLWCIYLSFLMYSVTFQAPPEGANIIVLGAQVHHNGVLSLSLSQRIDLAYEYLEENPEAVCIVTGGQGGDEPFPEAHAERDALLAKGINESRIYIEDTSNNTRQNFENALEIIEQENLGDTFAVVTQDFHMFRALQLGKSAGLQAYALSVKSHPLLYPSYYGRELLSLTKWHIQELLHIGG